MNPNEHKAYLKKFKKFSADVTSSKEKALEILVKAGINTPTGRLTKPYKKSELIA